MYTPQGFVPESSARWLISEIAKEASLQGSSLSDWDLKVLSSPVSDFQDNQRHLVEATHNLAVNLARSAIEHAKEQGLETLEVREGLVIPQIWEDHYQTVYESEFPWLVSLVMQNAFLGNPLIDETEPWNSPEGGGVTQIQDLIPQRSAGESVQTSTSAAVAETQPKNKIAIYALVLGIASVFLFETFIIPMASIVVGGIGLGRASELKTEGVQARGFGFSLAGLILGIVYTLGALIIGTGLV